MTSYDNLQIGDQKCHGIYLGTVVQHLAHGKLKVHVHGIYPEEFKNQPDKLPTCIQVVSQFAGSHSGNGVFSYPNVGATVVCMFANGDQNLPLMIGTLLGGENAFGQYEIVKSADEISSTRHLVTAGQAHVELYESGKISSIVVDPILTESKVSYDSSINGQLSIDAVSERPTWEKVDAQEISSINCQHVLDNHENKGTISSSTFWYNPISEQGIVSSNGGSTILISSITGEEGNDSHAVENNVGQQYFGEHCNKSTKYFANETNSQEGSTSIVVAPFQSESSIEYSQSTAGTNSIGMKSSSSDSFTKITRTPQNTEVSTLNMFDEHNSGFMQSMPMSFSLSGEIDDHHINAYASNQPFIVKHKDLKMKASNSFQATDKMKIQLNTLSSSKLQETDTTINLVSHVNKHNAFANALLDAEHGFTLSGQFNDDDTQVLGQTTIQIKKNNVAYIDAKTSTDALVKIYARDKFTRMIDSTIKKNDIECWQYMMPADGQLEISICDKVESNSCKILMTSDGIASITATKSINIEAPTITMVGQTMSQQFKTMSTKASTMNIQGANGDCKIKNVSLINHVHMETQAGDVVKPQPTKSATQSN